MNVLMILFRRDLFHVLYPRVVGGDVVGGEADELDVAFGEFWSELGCGNGRVTARNEERDEGAATTGGKTRGQPC
jgi:hypothetical protein